MRKLLSRIIGKKSTLAEADKPFAHAGPDTALANYLRYYSTLGTPGYAVLVTGPWGVGKTHQVKEIIPEAERYFVSLYGLDSVNSIHDAVLAACLPSLNAGEYVSTLGEVGKAMGDKYALAGFANSVWNAFLRQRLKPDRTIIFDDLERSPLWATQTSELLGAINHYVEHRGFRVVVICHDERIADELAELKEKTFGHTVQAAPQTAAAFDAFLADLPSQTTRTFVTERRSLIEEIWAQSGQSSLRILKHVINDIARLSATFDPRHLANQDAIDHVLRFFCALDIEVRAGSLNRDLLTGRMERYVSERMNRDAPEEETPFSAIVSRYASSDLTGKILSDEIVEATLIEGRFDAEFITAWLDQTPYFIKASDAAPWLIVMKLDELDDDILNEGIVRMQRQFDERSVTNMGEFLHIAALRLMMAEQNVSGRSMEEETSLSLKYIDDLLSDGRLPAKSLEYDPLERLFNAYGGYGYWVTDAARPHFDTICKYVDRARHLALEATYPDQATEVLRQLKEDPSSIFQTISPTNYGTNTLAHIPILAQIPPKSFVDAWIGGPRNGWRQTTMALDNRYEHGQLDRHLRDERPWLIELEREMDARIDAAAGLDAFRLKRIKPKIFDEARPASEPQ
ncbi:P-loop NTPase fold protein [Arvimicrobium flavum]|uniref:P-loop NTPase fold protein n=1 Tax=Arvimicrobium flavum TaxID=3393320 RepID=UPI0030842563